MSPPAATPTPPPADLPGDLVPERLGRYAIEAVLARGRRGTIVQGRDAALRRVAALKVLNVGDDLFAAGQMIAAARDQGNLQHDSICRVYDAGFAGGIPYIAMELLHAAPIDLTAVGLSVPAKAELLRQAAAALAYAHGKSVLHGNLGSSNVLVAGATGETPRVVLTDFGLPPVAAGGPGEQDDGVAPERRNPGSAGGLPNPSWDVYAFGAVAYRVLFGAGSDADRAVDGATSARRAGRGGRTRWRNPRRREVPAPLWTIVSRCLMADPGLRYVDAVVLSRDLEDYCRSGRISTKLPTLVDRAALVARRHRLAAGAAAAGLTVLLAAATWFSLVAWSTERRLAVERSYRDRAATLVEQIHSEYRALNHDLGPLLARVGLARSRLEQDIAAGDDDAVGVGELALAQIDLAMHRGEAAMNHIARARRAGFASPELGRGLIAATYERFIDAESAARPIWDPALRAAAHRRARETLAEPALAEHSRLLTAAPADPQTDAIAVLLAGRYEEAVGKADRALPGLRYAADAHRLKGDAYVLAARQAAAVAATDQARALYGLAGASYEAAGEVAPSDQAVLLGECDRLIDVLQLEESEPAAGSSRALDAALAACARTIRVDAEQSPGYARQALALAVYLRRVAADPERRELALGYAGQVIRLAGEAVRRAPDDSRALALVAMGFRERARLERAAGRESAGSLREARKAADRALQSDAGDPYLHGLRGWLELDAVAPDGGGSGGVQARAEELALSYARAVESFRQADELDGGLYTVNCAAGEVLLSMANAQRAAGQDPLPTLQASLGRFEKSLLAAPDFAAAGVGAATAALAAALGTGQGSPELATWVARAARTLDAVAAAQRGPATSPVILALQSRIVEIVAAASPRQSAALIAGHLRAHAASDGAGIEARCSAP
ncbi:MAG: protein kinase [Candidatus Schekmanbacteria bacterium]|nr:protein kinase [Candidatus Schekmanbacteria bacterium]